LSLATETQSVVDMMIIVFHCPQRASNRTSTFSLTVTASSLPLSIHPLAIYINHH